MEQIILLLTKLSTTGNAGVEYPQSDAHKFDPRSVDQREGSSWMEISEKARSLREVPISYNYIFTSVVFSPCCIFLPICSCKEIS